MKMNIDYLYCLNQDTCIHRRGCKRWIGNYTDDEAIEEADNNTRGYIKDEVCLYGHLNYSGWSPYMHLDRFRQSNGWPLQQRPNKEIKK